MYVTNNVPFGARSRLEGRAVPALCHRAQKKLYSLAQKPEMYGMKMIHSMRCDRFCSSLMLLATGSLLSLGTAAALAAGNTTPPPGFTSLFNGKDLTGWRGGDTFDHRKLLAMPAEQREAQIAKWTASMKDHWTVENGELVNDGHGAYATTEKD